MEGNLLDGSLNRDDIVHLLTEVGMDLYNQGLTGEIVLAGGAVMLLVLRNREVTKDVDAYLAPPAGPLREAAHRVGARHGLRQDWLNDGVKGFFYGTPPQHLIMEVPGLRVFSVTPAYLLVMKAMAGRPEDVSDTQALIAYLELKTVDEVLALVERYVPARIISPHVRYFLEDVMEGTNP